MNNVNFPKVSIIIPVHNRINQTLLCLDSCKKIDYPNFDIVIIDDGSTDDSEQIILNSFPEVTILKGDGNFLWSKSINTGIKHCINNSTDYVLLLNNDNIVDKNIITKLLNCAERYSNSLICSKIYDYNERGKIFFGGGESNPLYFLPHYQLTPFGKIDGENYQKFRELKYAIGMGILIPVSIIKSIGFYNENDLPHYYSDVEFTLRARKLGIKLIFNPKAILWNDTNLSWKFPEQDYFANIFLDKKSPYYYKAVIFMYLKYQPIYNWLPALVLYVFKAIIPVTTRKIPIIKNLLQNNQNKNSKLLKIFYID